MLDFYILGFIGTFILLAIFVFFGWQKYTSTEAKISDLIFCFCVSFFWPIMLFLFLLLFVILVIVLSSEKKVKFF